MEFWDVLVMQHQFFGHHSRCLSIGGGLMMDEVKACGGAIINTFGDRC